MKRFAITTVLAAATMTAATATANPALGLSETLEQEPVAMQQEGLHEAPDFDNQCGHWEYRTTAVPIWGYDYWGNYCVIDYRYVTQRVWVYH